MQISLLTPISSGDRASERLRLQPESAECNPLAGLQGFGGVTKLMGAADNIVALMLESQIIRVCASCEQEFGPVPVEPGVSKSHGYCRRHLIQVYRENGMANLLPELQAREDEKFSPDLAEVNRS